MPDSAALQKAAAGSAGQENTLRFVMNVGGRRWRLVAIFVIIGIVLTVTTQHIYFNVLLGVDFSPSYVASADLTIQRSRWETGLLKNITGRPIFENTPSALAERVPKHLLAEAVARALIQHDLSQGGVLGAVATEQEYDAKAQQILKALTIEPIDKLDRVRIAVRSRSPAEARQMADLALRIFVERNREFLVSEEEKTHEFVQGQLDDLRKRLDTAEDRLRQLHEEMGYRTHLQVTQEIQRTRQQIVDAQTLRTETQARIGEIEAELRRKNEELPQALGQITDTVVNRLLADLDQLIQQRVILGVDFEPEWHECQEVEYEIEQKRAAVREAVRQMDVSVEGGSELWQERQNLRRRHVDQQLELAALDIREGSLRKLLEKLEESLPAIIEKNKEYEQLDREVRQLQDQHSRFLDLDFEVQTAIRRGTSQLAREGGIAVDEAVEPRATRRWWMNVPIGAFIGFVCGFSVAVLLEWLDTSIRTIEDVSLYLNQEVIGTIPLMKFGKSKTRLRGNYVPISDDEQVDACIVTQHDPKSPISEAYRTLRTNFQFATMHLKPRTVMVTSAVPGEGKTTTAVNMAVAFADSGKRVLIIDTDLRRPHVHHVLRMKRGPGLADVLREGTDYRSVVRATRIQNLSIVTSGRVPPNPSELIGSQRMRDLMAQLGAEFDLVICDAPSILVVTDPVLLATDVDALVLVVSVKNARRETIARGIQLLQTAQANMAGVVLNGLEATRRHYYYYYYYYDDQAARKRHRWIHL